MILSWNTLALEITHAVVATLWQGTLFTMVAAMASAFIAQQPRIRYVIHLLSLVGLGLCFSLNLFYQLGIHRDSMAVGGQTQSYIEEVSLSGSENTVVSSKPWIPGNNVDSFLTLFAPHIAALYFLGLGLMFCRFGFGILTLQGIKSRVVEIEESCWIQSLVKSGRSIGLKTLPALAWSKSAASPIVVGLFRPIILIPETLRSSFTLQQIEAILLHELAHLKRWDHWGVLVQRILETVLFFHPAMWWTSRQLNKLREEACDDLVVSRGAQPATYVSALLLCSEFPKLDTTNECLAATGNKGSNLYRRMKRILGQPEANSVQPSFYYGTVIALVLIVCITSWIQSDSVRAEELERSDIPSISEVDFKIAATVNGYIITKDSIYKEAEPLRRRIRNESANEEDFEKRYNYLLRQILKSKIDRRLLIEEFNSSETYSIPDEIFIREELRELNERFAGSEQIFEGYLSSENMTRMDYREQMRNNILVSVMEHELQRKFLEKNGENSDTREHIRELHNYKAQHLESLREVHEVEIHFGRH